ncbi:MAG: VPLPA-CTERM sorting domain-containing protein [Smithella sp.]
MKKDSLSILSVISFSLISLVMLLSPTKASAYSINFLNSINGNEYISSYNNVTTESFDSGGTTNWIWSGNYAIVDGSTTGKNAAPYGKSSADASFYITVPKDVTAQSVSATATLPNTGSYYNYFGLWWGSVDAYNTITFLKDGNETGESFTGTQVVGSNAANGSQTDPNSNLYVNFVDLKDFNGVRLTSSQYAFEADNLSAGRSPVPIPAAAWLLGSGFIGLVGIRRKLNK